MEVTHASNIHSPSSLPTRGQDKVWELSALTAILPETRSIIERVFGMMKTRFRAIFLQALEVLEVITACAILHNICLGAGDVMAPEDDPEDAVEEDEGEVGTLWQDQLSAEVSALEE
ncbi:hypothetical protein CHARACLAT_033495 [Characodon lateralis]|uniref:DDE Tnp4 domain-containing protein n=1 Tax=Characodon lateralis TaxID=208331 RepID=A0ABU7F871_9TELE|nr:hypothetical protein [Characodon lateralis]